MIGNEMGENVLINFLWVFFLYYLMDFWMEVQILFMGIGAIALPFHWAADGRPI